MKVPQLDATTYASQLFWLISCFIVLYWIMARHVLPRFSEVLAHRQNRIDSDLAAAQAAQAEAEKVVAEYEEALLKAREDANAMVQAQTEKTKRAIEARQKKMEEDLERKASIAEEKIATIHRRALADLSEMAVSIAKTTTAKFLEASLSEGQVRKAVESIRPSSATGK